MDYCEHVSTIIPVTPSADGCEDCLKIGGRWVHIRLCENCGHVGCCDNSPNQHASKHFSRQRSRDHQIDSTVEEWGYCYVDDAFYDPLPKPT